MLGLPAQGRALARRIGALAGAAGAVVLLASCATVPARTPSQWMGVLPGDATLYASLRVRSSPVAVARLLLSARPQDPGAEGTQPPAPGGPSASELDQLVERTERIVLAATPVPGSPPSFSAVALGSYPAGIIGCRLSGSREWSRLGVGSARYWQSKKAGLQVAAPGRGVLLAASGGIEGLLERYRAPVVLPMPDEVRQDMESRDLVLFLPELPGSALPAGAGQVPIREVWVIGAKGPGGWSVTGTANTASERDAKLVALALRFAFVAWMRGQSIQGLADKLRAVTILPEASQVRLEGLSLSDEELGQVLLGLVAGQRAE